MYGNSPRIYSTTLHTILNMPGTTCPFGTGAYTISALSGPVGGGPCDDRIVVKDQSVGLDCFLPFLWRKMICHQTFSIIQNVYGPDNCSYSISLYYQQNLYNVIGDAFANVIFTPDQNIVHEWVVTPVGDKFT